MLEIEVHRAGASSRKEYIYDKFRGLGRDPYTLDILKSAVLFLIAIGSLAVFAALDLGALGLVLIPVIAYTFIFFVRVWWRVVTSTVSGKTYERV